MAELLADRFLVFDEGVSVDLASAEHVTIRIRAQGVRQEHQRWIDRCASLASCRHSNVVDLVDYGLIGSDRRFEAYRLESTATAPRVRSSESAKALESAVDFLHAAGLSAGALSWDRLLRSNGTMKLLPDGSTGQPLLDRSAEGAALDVLLKRSHVASRSGISNLGVVLQPRPAVQQVIDWLDAAQAPSAILYLAGPPKSGKTTAIETVAREARLRGFIPLSISVMACKAVGGAAWECEVRQAVAGRHVLLLDDRTHQDQTDPRREALSDILLKLGASANRSILALVVAASGQQKQPWVLLEPLSTESLQRAMILSGPARRRRAIVSAVARAAEGRPGWCLARLEERCGLPSQQSRQRMSRATQVSESSPAYEARHLSGDRRALKQLQEAEGLMRRGRHAAAERHLRSSLGAFGRREDALNAGRSGVLLGQLLLARGSASDALSVFGAAREQLLRASATALAANAMVYTGVAQTDEGMFEESEATLHTAHAASSVLEEPACEILAVLALARCLFWRGKYGEAQVLLEDGHCFERTGGVQHGSSATPAGAPVDGARRWCRYARILLALGDIERAGAFARRAGAFAEQDFATSALVCSTQALIQARVGDVDAVRLHVRRGLDAARLAYLPLRAFGLRLTLCEALANTGEIQPAHRFCLRIAGRKRSSLPALSRARLDRLLRAIESSAKHATKSPPAVCESSARPPFRMDPAPNPAELAHVTEILSLCHEVEDERETLSRAAEATRRQVQALAAGFFGKQETSAVHLGGGGALGAGVAERSIDSGLPIQPHRTASGIEAAVPVRYAGTTVGALGCRWTVAGPPDSTRALGLMTITAAACAPLLHILHERRVTNFQPAQSELEGSGLLGTSGGMQNVRRAVLRASNAPFTVLIEGESGSGKELVAHALHDAGCRRDRRFRALNCAALTEDLLDAELFGHARGAFTGALLERAGLFEDAAGGTVFLDEISELSPRGQAKLLRVIQEGEIRRIGENFTRPIDTRLIAATNRSLQAEVEAGRFRHDLLYRLNVIRIAVPPLRERIEDVPILAAKFWREATGRIGSKAVLGQSAIAALARYDWPGNVRELQNVLYAMAVNGPSRGVVNASALPGAVAQQPCSADCPTLEAARCGFEQRFVRAALARAAGHRGRTAAALGLSRQGLSKLMHRLNLEAPEPGL